MIRILRNEPFCWQAKAVFRALRKQYSGRDLVKMRCLYTGITEIASDKGTDVIETFNKVVQSYTGLPRDFIPTGVKNLKEMGAIKVVEKRDGGRFSGTELHLLEFTGVKNTVTVKSEHGNTGPGKTVTGKPDTLECTLFGEGNSLLESNSGGNSPSHVVIAAVFDSIKTEIYNKKQKPRKLSDLDIRNVKKILKRYSMDEIEFTIRYALSTNFVKDNPGRWANVNHIFREQNFDRYYNESQHGQRQDRSIGSEAEQYYNGQ